MKSKGGALAKYTAAMLIFGTIGIFRRNLPLPSELIAFFRGVIGCGFIAAFMAIKKSGGRTGGELKKKRRAEARALGRDDRHSLDAAFRGI